MIEYIKNLINRIKSFFIKPEFVKEDRYIKSIMNPIFSSVVEKERYGNQ